MLKATDPRSKSSCCGERIARFRSLTCYGRWQRSAELQWKIQSEGTQFHRDGDVHSSAAGLALCNGTSPAHAREMSHLERSEAA